MAAVFDLAKTRIGNKRDQVEDALRDRVDKFETKVFIQNIFGDFDSIWNGSRMERFNQTFSIWRSTAELQYDVGE